MTQPRVSRTTPDETGQGHAYVLVVDDEPPVREFLTRWLEGWGYAVVSINSIGASRRENMSGRPPS